MMYLSVCSGIEAASVAFEPLGWTPLAFSEIEPFPCSVLEYHYPTVPNLGDMTKYRDWNLDILGNADVLVGGTPCQAFSVAGLRAGLEDERGQLTLTYIKLLDRIDEVRSLYGEQPTIAIWENVPGVLSSKDNAFGAFLGGLCGEDRELVPSGKRWTDAGCVHGPKRTVAWRILDAQFFGVAQRRKRVFVVASARDIDPSEILFEFDGVRRDTPPSREAGERIAPTVTGGAPFSRTGKERVECEALIPYQDTVGALCARDFKGVGSQYVDEGKCIALAGSMIGRQDHNGPNGSGIFEEHCPTLTSTDRHAVSFQQNASGELRIGNIGYTLNTNSNASGRNTGMVLNYTQVRRLTPIECERLQGFPDNYTNVPHRNKPAADGPRYKALGNSMAVPVMRWIGERIDKFSNNSYAIIK